jgi:predicted ArsR family transcriptional regulator
VKEVAVSLPERHYDLAGELMARAIDESGRSGGDVVASLQRAASERGAAIGEQARAQAGSRAGRTRRIATACDALAEHGYEPRQEDRSIVLANCPFHALAREHTELVCGMNLALVGAVVEQVDARGLTARLDPDSTRCCVVIDTERARR